LHYVVTDEDFGGEQVSGLPQCWQLAQKQCKFEAYGWFLMNIV